METLINSTSIGNIIITAGSVILLLVLIKLFAWEQLTGIFTAREKKLLMMLMVQKQRVKKQKLLLLNARKS
ncbi:F0F1 ATP synthase b chain [Streptococcus infantarius subsp. infantarius CJ18]|nr:F0F1 ATP synthase b chain [Streptococcus infantarius subsp. infantarius CJ18]